MTKDQLIDKMRKEIKQLTSENDRLRKDVDDAERWAKTFEDKVEELRDEVEDLKLRDKLAGEIISSCWLDWQNINTGVYRLITDWEQAGFYLSR